MKTRKIISLALALIMTFALVPAMTAMAEETDTSWKEYLKDFLENNLPSLYDETTIAKNKKLFSEWESTRFDENYYNKYYSYEPPAEDIPVDAIFPPWNDSDSKWIANGPYYPLLLPLECNFYDLDSDGIPEVFVTYPSIYSEGSHDFIYKLNGETYELIYSNLKSVYLYKNSDNKLVAFEGFYIGIDAVYFAEIKYGELIFRDYIDSTGGNMLDGIEYKSIGDDDSWGFMEKVIEADNLIPLAEFDCSDVAKPTLNKVYFFETAQQSFLLLGDSIATGYGLPNIRENSYGAKLANALGVDYYNLAVDGATSGDLLALLKETDIAALLAEQDIVVISIGGNDILSIFFALAKQALGLAPTASNLELQAAIESTPNAVSVIGMALLLNQSKLTAATNAFPENLSAIVKEIKSANPDAQLIIQTIYNPFSGVPGMETLSAAAETIISQMNGVIYSDVTAGGYEVADIYGEFQDNALLYTNIGEFDIHPNTAGHEKIFELLYEMIAVEDLPDLSTANDWAHEYIINAIKNGLVPAKLQGSYGNNTTRAEFCALAVALYETVTGEEITGRETFTDTNDINVEKAAFIGVVKGVSDGKFAPDSLLNREQAATMLSRLADALDKPLINPETTFADKDEISDWAVDAVNKMQAAGIMQGVGGNRFSPKTWYTREQSIITILRLFNEVKA